MATADLSQYNSNEIPNAEAFRFGIVVSDWNSYITHNLLNGAVETLQKFGVKESNIKICHVPGSFELVFSTHKFCKEKDFFNAVIAIGCVIRGETPHFEYVCNAVSQGIKDINILTQTPAIFCVLTDDNEQQSIDRSGGKLGNKGIEAAITAIKMAHFNKYSI